MADLQGVTLEDLSFLENIFLPKQKPEEDPSSENGERYIMHSKRIDSKTVIRTRVTLNDGVCDVCGLDLVKLAYDRNKVSVSSYVALPFELQLQFKEAVQKHKNSYHSEAENMIVTKKPRKWLSGRQV